MDTIGHMGSSESYAGTHENMRRACDSHGNTLDGPTFRAVMAMRDEYRAKIAALLPKVTREGREVLQEYLDQDETSEADACLGWWLAGCENHENGSDA